MLFYALVFMMGGLIAGGLHLAGVSLAAFQFSWILLLIGVVLVAIHLISTRAGAPIISRSP